VLQPSARTQKHFATEPDEMKIGNEPKEQIEFKDEEDGDSSDSMDPANFKKLMKTNTMKKGTSSFVKPSGVDSKLNRISVGGKVSNTTINEAKTASEDDNSSKVTPSQIDENISSNTRDEKVTKKENTLTFCKTSPVGSRGPS
jgi:hypothetical protein